MKKCIFNILFLFVCIHSNAQTSLPLDIPLNDLLLQNAHSIKNHEESIFEIKSADKATLKVHKIITVLDESAKSELYFYAATDKFISLESVSIILSDLKGNKLRQYTKKDLQSFIYGDGLVTDGKNYHLNIPTSFYPVQILSDYELKFTGLISYPMFQVQEYAQSVVNSSFQVIVPPDWVLRYKEMDIDLQPVITSSKNEKTFTWTVKNLPALRHEEGSVSIESSFPRILLAPSRFSLDGYKGDLSSWEKFGEWYGTLSKTAMDLSPERKLFFQSLVSTAKNDREKAALVYKYLQQNFRYVSIQLGIGGFKPFNASFTDNKKYGDCKALSNYTQACLDAVSVKSYQALINASYNKKAVDPSFPINMFNHVILCVPLENDSIWLECTSNTNDFGVLGSFTENRNALLIRETGGVLVPTPKSKSTSNIFNAFSMIVLNEDGSGHAKVKITTEGEYNHPGVLTDKPDEQKRYFVNEIDFNEPDDIVLLQGKGGKNRVDAEMSYSKIVAFTAGNKMFLHPRIHNIWNGNLPASLNRKKDYYFHHPFIKNDSTVYQLPEGYMIDEIPKTIKFGFELGNYEVQYSYDKVANQLTTIARLELLYHIIPVKKYAETKTFFDAVMKEFNNKIIISKT
jgi:hypothetical protein